MTELLFSTSSRSVGPGEAHELSIPTETDGCFLFFKYACKADGDLRFEIRDESGDLLLEELQTSSNDKLRVVSTRHCLLRWVNESWLEYKDLSYAVRVASDLDIAASMKGRLLRAARNGQLDAVREALALGAPPDSTDDTGYTPLMLATLAHEHEACHINNIFLKHNRPTQ